MAERLWDIFMQNLLEDKQEVEAMTQAEKVAVDMANLQAFAIASQPVLEAGVMTQVDKDSHAYDMLNFTGQFVPHDIAVLQAKTTAVAGGEQATLGVPVLGQQAPWMRLHMPDELKGYIRF